MLSSGTFVKRLLKACQKHSNMDNGQPFFFFLSLPPLSSINVPWSPPPRPLTYVTYPHSSIFIKFTKTQYRQPPPPLLPGPTHPFRGRLLNVCWRIVKVYGRFFLRTFAERLLEDCRKFIVFFFMNVCWTSVEGLSEFLVDFFHERLLNVCWRLIASYSPKPSNLFMNVRGTFPEGVSEVYRVFFHDRLLNVCWRLVGSLWTVVVFFVLTNVRWTSAGWLSARNPSTIDSAVLWPELIVSVIDDIFWSYTHVHTCSMFSMLYRMCCTSTPHCSLRSRTQPSQ